MNSTVRPSVTIVGAGITGPTAALALAHAGYHVTVLEQRPASELHSNGLMGLTPAHWHMLETAGVNLAPHELGRSYREYGRGMSRMPFRTIIWTDLHNAIVQCAQDAGAVFGFGTPRIDPAHVMGEYVIDAGGVTSAARRRLPRSYIGMIYRGISPLNTSEDFTTYKMPGKVGFLDIGRSRTGAWWAFGTKNRPAPAHFHSYITTDMPAEIDDLPEPYRHIIKATREILVLPQASWSAPRSVYDPAWRRFTLGDANGAVRPLTTSGANLGIQAGMLAPALLGGSRAVADSILSRRAYALSLGLRLRGPEIAGTFEDPDFQVNQRGLYGVLAR